MINQSQPDTIDERVINTKKLTTFKMTVSGSELSHRLGLSITHTHPVIHMKKHAKPELASFAGLSKLLRIYSLYITVVLSLMSMHYIERRMLM